jgi:hypothetical protein
MDQMTHLDDAMSANTSSNKGGYRPPSLGADVLVATFQGFQTFSRTRVRAFSLHRQVPFAVRHPGKILHAINISTWRGSVLRDTAIPSGRRRGSAVDTTRRATLRYPPPGVWMRCICAMRIASASSCSASEKAPKIVCHNFSAGILPGFLICGRLVRRTAMSALRIFLRRETCRIQREKEWHSTVHGACASGRASGVLWIQDC